MDSDGHHQPNTPGKNSTDPANAASMDSDGHHRPNTPSNSKNSTSPANAASMDSDGQRRPSTPSNSKNITSPANAASMDSDGQHQPNTPGKNSTIPADESSLRRYRLIEVHKCGHHRLLLTNMLDPILDPIAYLIETGPVSGPRGILHNFFHRNHSILDHYVSFIEGTRKLPYCARCSRCLRNAQSLSEEEGKEEELKKQGESIYCCRPHKHDPPSLKVLTWALQKEGWIAKEPRLRKLAALGNYTRAEWLGYLEHKNLVENFVKDVVDRDVDSDIKIEASPAFQISSGASMAASSNASSGEKKERKRWVIPRTFKEWRDDIRRDDYLRKGDPEFLGYKYGRLWLRLEIYVEATEARDDPEPSSSVIPPRSGATSPAEVLRLLEIRRKMTGLPPPQVDEDSTKPTSHANAEHLEES